MPRGNGGIIGPVNTSFSGVWSLTEAQLRRSGNTWPNFYTALLSESATGSDVFSGADAADPYFEYTTLLLPGNGTNGAQNNTFLDASTNNFTITRNGSTTQGTFSPFSQTGWGNYLGTTSDRLTTATSNSAFSFGTGGASNVGDFTIEGFVNLNSINANMIFQMSTASTGYNPSTSNTIALYVGDAGSAGKIEIYVANSSLISTNVVVTSADIGQWRHFAIVRTSGVTSVYWNGSIVAGLSAITDTTNYTMTYCVIGTVYNNTYGLKGYLSNFRVVKGTSLYSGSTITIPTSTLTAVTNTSFLIANSNRFRDISSNAIGLNTSGSPSVQAFSPFNPSASWSAATYGGSGYFDGSGDYLTTPANAAFQVGTGDFTIECWLYLSATGVNDGVITECRSSGASSTGFVFNTRQATGGYKLNFYTDGAGNTASTTLPYNMWNHVAVSRSGTTVRLFANGVVDLTFTKSNNYTDNPGVQIGQSTLYTSSNITGYMQGLRFVKGTAVYTGAFTPPIAPLSTSGAASASAYSSTTNVNTSFASSETSLLLNFTNAGIYDATSKNDLETVGNAQISTAISAKWGSGSMYFDGTGDWAVMPASSLMAMGTGDFTWEAWIYATAASDQPIYECRSTSSNTDGFTVTAFSSTVIRVYTVSVLVTATISNYLNTWTHVAFTRSGSTNRLFINGTLQNTATALDNFSNQVAVVGGGRYNSNNIDKSFTGYMQDVRVTKGYARYTSNFTPPTAAFPTF